MEIEFSHFKGPECLNWLKIDYKMRKYQDAIERDAHSKNILSRVCDSRDPTIAKIELKIERKLSLKIRRISPDKNNQTDNDLPIYKMCAKCVQNMCNLKW